MGRGGARVHGEGSSAAKNALTKSDFRAVAKRLQDFGIELVLQSSASANNVAIRAVQSNSAPPQPESYTLTIEKRGIEIHFRDLAGWRAAVATLRQLLREYGRELPCMEIRDWPDFPRRGVMLDISRGRVPKVETLLQLVDHLADFKINEFQLYTEHTFAYRQHKAVWQPWSALTASEIRRLDQRCRELGIDLVPNQNSFGHLREFLADPKLKRLAEVSEPYESVDGSFLRYPSTLAPNHPGTLPFLRNLYDELLPNFRSAFFNVGGDETWDLGRGQSKSLCDRLGKGRVYLDFLKRIHHEVSTRGRTMMFWGDIILNHPGLIRDLPKNVIALNWGYEADHPFNREAAQFRKAGIPFYVCPGTSTWMTLIGRHDNALPNLRTAAIAGRKHGAIGYLITDWGDGGHPQPLAVSYLPFVAGAALAWCASSFDDKKLEPVLSRDIFNDSSGKIAKAAQALGVAHRKLGYFEPNATPLGAAVAAPPPDQRELFCRNGLKYHAWISGKKIKAAMREIEKQRSRLNQACPKTPGGKVLQQELDLAARMAFESGRFMLWQQSVANGDNIQSRRLATAGLRELRGIEKDFNRYWPTRNKGSTKKCSAFLNWRQNDYRRATF
ncbi:MAG TPA: family 20 glycosylhydrolase [Verrucomicrobiae bacterium]|nr:family 20 glycosylhydrolase [Verrucomicrobiae bacterium]